jgi:hypothetical protein
LKKFTAFLNLQCKKSALAGSIFNLSEPAGKWCSIKCNCHQTKGKMLSSGAAMGIVIKMKRAAAISRNI